MGDFGTPYSLLVLPMQLDGVCCASGFTLELKLSVHLVPFHAFKKNMTCTLQHNMNGAECKDIQQYRQTYGGRFGPNEA